MGGLFSALTMGAVGGAGKGTSENAQADMKFNYDQIKEQIKADMEARIYERSRKDKDSDYQRDFANQRLLADDAAARAESLQDRALNKADKAAQKTEDAARVAALREVSRSASDRLKAVQIQLANDPQNEQLRLQQIDNIKEINDSNTLLKHYAKTGKFDVQASDPLGVGGDKGGEGKAGEGKAGEEIDTPPPAPEPEKTGGLINKVYPSTPEGMKMQSTDRAAAAEAERGRAEAMAASQQFIRKLDKGIPDGGAARVALEAERRFPGTLTEKQKQAAMKLTGV